VSRQSRPALLYHNTSMYLSVAKLLALMVAGQHSSSSSNQPSQHQTPQVARLRNPAKPADK